ncbi:MAG: methylmalonyl-CoA epimerase [Caldiserica bacterium]|nr:methylmalonyl-CoA epimerase [Caldisericota bacterium]MDH7561807.1 methylmalonyl-CoA epimerase [Caldisericota bacterium]
MLKKIEHVGIAVNSLEKSIPVFKNLGMKFLGIEEVPSQKVKVAMFEIGDVHVELLEPTSPDSAIGKFLEKRGEGLHHIAFETEDIEGQMREYKTLGFEFIDQEPREGSHDTWIFFLHPRSTNSVLTEICSHKK